MCSTTSVALRLLPIYFGNVWVRTRCGEKRYPGSTAHATFSRAKSVGKLEENSPSTTKAARLLQCAFFSYSAQTFGRGRETSLCPTSDRCTEFRNSKPMCLQIQERKNLLSRIGSAPKDDSNSTRSAVSRFEQFFRHFQLLQGPVCCIHGYTIVWNKQRRYNCLLEEHSRVSSSSY